MRIVHKVYLHLMSSNKKCIPLQYSSSVVDVEAMNEQLSDVQAIFEFPDEPSRIVVISRLSSKGW